MPHPLRIRANAHKRDAPLVAARRRQTRASRPAAFVRELNRRYGPTSCKPAQVDLLGAEVRELGKTLHWTYCDQNCIEVDEESDPPRRLIMGGAHNRPWATPVHGDLGWRHRCSPLHAVCLWPHGRGAAG